MDPLRTLLLVALSLALAVSGAVLGGPAGAAASTKIYSEIPRPTAFVSKPSTVGYLPPTTPGISIKVKGLRWSGWGSRRARASGRARICPSMSKCSRPRTRVIAGGRYRSEGPTRIYSKITFKFPRGVPFDRKIKLCIAGEVCDPFGPVGRG